MKAVRTQPEKIMTTTHCEFGVGDCSYKMAGELSGITDLVNQFYDNMSEFDEAKKIRSMHSSDLSESRKKLTYFLSGWLGGPKIYSEFYGEIIIPLAHRHLSVGVKERDAWLICMEKAIAEQAYEESFKKYLLEQLSVPAERIRMACNVK